MHYKNDDLINYYCFFRYYLMLLERITYKIKNSMNSIFEQCVRELSSQVSYKQQGSP